MKGENNMEKYNELKAMVESFYADFEKFYVKGNKAAGTRVRKNMNELKKKAQEIRIDVQNIKGTPEKSSEETTEAAEHTPPPQENH
jgi:cytochrome c556